MTVMIGLLSLATTPARSAADPGDADPHVEISGRVVDADGEPVGGIWIHVATFLGDEPEAVTDDEGRWQVDVRPGTHRIQAVDPQGALATTAWVDQAYIDDGKTLVVTEAGQAEPVEIVMPPAARLSGSVLPEGADRWAGRPAEVTVFRLREPGRWQTWDDRRPVEQDGDFEIGGLPAGTYRLEFDQGSRAPQYWRGARSLEGATDMVLATGQHLDSLDARLARLGSISGRVVDHAGEPLAGVLVALHRIAEDPFNEPMPQSIQITEPDGTYHLPTLQPGVYQVAIGLNDFSRRYAGRWWPDAGEGRRRAVMIEVGLREDVTGVDARLDRPAGIAGSITTADASDGRRVVLYERDGDRWTVRAHQDARSRESGSPLTFEFAGLPPGSYRLCARSGDSPGCWPGGRYVEDAGNIVVGSGQVARLTVVDPAVTDVSGTLVGPSEEEGGDRRVEAWVRAADTWKVVAGATFDRAGHWSMALPAGSYRLRGVIDGREAWWRNGDDMVSADELVVRAGEPREGIAIAVTGGASLRGSVGITDGGSPPAAGPDVVVHRRDATGDWRRIASTYGDEDWTIGGLRDGTYRLEYTNHRGGTVRQFWPDSDTFDGAEDIVVSGRDIDGLDAELTRAGRIDATTIRARDGRGEGARWTVYSRSDGRWMPVEGLVTAPRTAYGILGVPPGTVRLGFEDPGEPWFAPEFWSEARSVETATDIEVEPGGRVSDIVATFDLQTHPVAAPRLLDRPDVGVAVRASSGVWSPLGTAVRRQWLLDGQPIAGATGAAYTPRPQDRGRALSLRVVGVRPGFVTGVADSAAVVVGAGAVRLLQRPRVVGSPDVGGTLRLTGGRWSPGEVRLTYRWLVGQRAVSRSARLRLRPAHAGRPVRVLVTASAPGLAPSTTTARMRGRVGR